MSYGSQEWQAWALGEEEASKHIKAAYVCILSDVVQSNITYVRCRYDAGIQTFDTADVRFHIFNIHVYCLSDPELYAGLLEWTVRGYPRQRHQEAQSSARRDRNPDQGPAILLRLGIIIYPLYDRAALQRGRSQPWRHCVEARRRGSWLRQSTWIEPQGIRLVTLT